ncbi:DUF547 domain-containing protein [Elioraea sp. Yellowstone]|jgi:hypothetical protein|uniref:DUF547 domain-containing protein n=1 Tax=Elioraea sp. Yellowstone TaxID=2592070 RepID=UPI00114FFEDE|nr:DUF547 domain-containing protein [Elioraea sp. Yellowstone]TQF82041.1 DUF547 domain-containing protein [Elioraea sp. Yellowstone]
MSTPSRRAAIIGAAALLASPAAALRAEGWTRWRRHTAGSRASVDHGAWDAFLAHHLHRGADGVNRLPYGAAKEAGAAALADYVRMLEHTDVDALDRPEQFCFWGNLYNARTVLLMIERWPVSSIREIAISPGLFSVGPWGRKLMRVNGEALSLDDVEHRILRPLWRDPRVHYVVNCASIGCPNLKPTAWRTATLEADLDAAARDFVNHPRGVAVQPDGRTVVSSIYRWFREDFGDGDAGVLAHLAYYAEPRLAAALRSRNRIDDHRYDWSANVWTRGPPA